MLAGSLDFEATLQLIARLAVPRLADWCFVELLREDGSIDRVAIEAADPAMLEHAREYDRRFPLDPDSPVGSPQVIRVRRTGPAARDPGRLARGGRPGLRAARAPACARLPLVDDRAAAGRRARRRRPRAGQRRIRAPLRRRGPRGAQELADRCGLYLENARLYRELERAHDELEAILAGVADAVTVQGHNGRLTYVNDAAVRLLGEPLGFVDRAGAAGGPPASSPRASTCSTRTASPCRWSGCRDGSRWPGRSRSR